MSNRSVLILLLVSSLSAGAHAAGKSKLTALGTTSFKSAASAAALAGPNLDREDTNDRSRENAHRQALGKFAADRRAKMSAAAKALAPTTIPHLSSMDIAETNHGAFGFAGLSNFQSAAVNHGFSTEPPDQALCVGNGFVLEGVNSALAVYDEHGNLMAGPVGNNDFFQDPQNVSDPRCLYDSATDRWFITLIDYPNTFDNNGILIAVSVNGDPTGFYNVYRLDVTGDGDVGDCPCLGDQPLIGADRNAYVVTTNAFGVFTFDGAQVYAFSKAALAAGSASVAFRHFGNLSAQLPGVEFAFSINPSITPPGDPGDKGTEWLAQSLGALPIENGLGVWAMSDTANIDSNPAAMTMNVQVVSTQSYAGPNPATQKAGPTPLAELAEARGVPGDDSEQRLDGDDVRMQQVTFVGGRLYAALGTAAVTPGSPLIDAAAWFAIDVKNTANGPTGTVAAQGYVAGPNSSSVIYPALTVNSLGQAAMVFTLTGPSFFPSAAYWRMGGRSIHLLEDGAAPQDGFSAYYFARPRWGDYSAATVGADGSLWIATELVPGGARKRFANWGTFIGRLRTHAEEGDND